MVNTESELARSCVQPTPSHQPPSDSNRAFSASNSERAAAGALTSRAEESQQAATPVMILLAVGYLGAFLAFQSPDGALVTVLSFVPFTAPWVMPARAAIGSVPPVAVAA